MYLICKTFLVITNKKLKKLDYTTSNTTIIYVMKGLHVARSKGGITFNETLPLEFYREHKLERYERRKINFVNTNATLSIMKIVNNVKL